MKTTRQRYDLHFKTDACIIVLLSTLLREYICKFYPKFLNEFDNTFLYYPDNVPKFYCS